MKRIEVYAVGIVLALVPAVFGLWGNASFSEAVPVRVPDHARSASPGQVHDARAVLAAHHAGRESEDLHARHGADDPVPHDAATHDVGDDHGGDRARGEVEPGDDHGGTSGSDSSGSDSSGTGSSGSGKDSSGSSGSGGSDDSGHSGGSDDKGSGGHGSDD